MRKLLLWGAATAIAMPSVIGSNPHRRIRVCHKHSHSPPAAIASIASASGSPEICISPPASMCSRVTNRVLLTVAVIVTRRGGLASGGAATS